MVPEKKKKSKAFISHQSPINENPNKQHHTLPFSGRRKDHPAPNHVCDWSLRNRCEKVFLTVFLNSKNILSNSNQIQIAKKRSLASRSHQRSFLSKPQHLSCLTSAAALTTTTTTPHCTTGVGSWCLEWCGAKT